MPRDERGKGFLGVLFRVLPQQGDVIQFVHLHLNAADWGKVTEYFKNFGNAGLLPDAGFDPGSSVVEIFFSAPPRLR